MKVQPIVKPLISMYKASGRAPFPGDPRSIFSEDPNHGGLGFGFIQGFHGFAQGAQHLLVSGRIPGKGPKKGMALDFLMDQDE